MTTILQIDSSITGAASVSRQLTAATVAQLLKKEPSATLIHRDLVADPLAHLTLGGVGDEDVLDEFLSADTIVIGAPMYNFSLPTQLKAWIDRISVAGKTFSYSEEGPKGLAGGRRVIVAISRGGFYTPDNAMEHVESYLKSFFNFIGIEPEFVHSDGINYGPDHREAGIANGLAEIEKLAA